MFSSNHENEPKQCILGMEVAIRVPYFSDFAVVPLSIRKNRKPDRKDSYWEIRKLYQHFENNSESNVFYHFDLLPWLRNLRSNLRRNGPQNAKG